RFRSVEMVRMVSSGTEASMSAIRLARAAAGRDTIVKFAGAYHGHVDGLLADAGSGLATQGIPASPGVTAAQAADTVVVPWNDRDAVEAALAARPAAALLCEPAPANMGLVPAEPGFLEHLREATTAAGTLLVFDEVISGFRVGPGGVQERTGVIPDLTILGKVLGGGLPAAAYAGPEGLMDQVAPAGPVYQAGTLSGNPLATAAGLATLRLLDAAAYERLEATTERLARGLEAAAADAGVAVTVPWTCGLLTVFVQQVAWPPVAQQGARPLVAVRDYEGAKACDATAYAAFCRALLERGVYPPASQFEAWFVSLAHDDEHVERTLEAAREAFASL
ncbi:MAG TPA: glutamate-1-semialdehyde 2,1-aminomutase, partial [Thermoleophilaceae bacterium]|nr:glutamate-1-semialdehyde 2,1-aminomutase [Thermoleophilaceae bacterium]